MGAAQRGELALAAGGLPRGELALAARLRRGGVLAAAGGCPGGHTGGSGAQGRGRAGTNQERPQLIPKEKAILTNYNYLVVF